MNISKAVDTRIMIEKSILAKIIDDAISRNYVISVYDGEELTLKHSQDKNLILKHTQSTDIDYLYINHIDGKKIGTIFLVYGNSGYDVICDYSANPEIEELLSGANILAKEFETKYIDYNF